MKQIKTIVNRPLCDLRKLQVTVQDKLRTIPIDERAAVVRAIKSA